MAKAPHRQAQPTAKGIGLYHRVLAHEGFEQAATALFEMVREAERRWPGKPRHLYLDIDGHRNDQGGYDADMFELQRDYVLGSLMPFLSQAGLPLLGVVKNAKQRNDLPERLEIRPASDGEQD